MDTDTAWVAALEQLPPDSHGFRRVLRLHAVAVQENGPAPRSVCGYRHEADELRPHRAWETVTASGKCALCEVQLRRAMVDPVIDLTEQEDPDSDSGTRRRLTIVPDETAASKDRRTGGRS